MRTAKDSSDARTHGDLIIEEPFPLKRLFLIIVLPGLVVALVGLLFVFEGALSSSVENAYSAEATLQHKLLVSRLDDRSFAAIAAGARGDIVSPQQGQQGQQAETAFSTEIKELGFSCAVIMTTDREPIVASDGTACIQLEPQEIRDLLDRGSPLFREDPGPPTSWIVVSAHDNTSNGDGLLVATRYLAANTEALIDSQSLLWVGAMTLLFLAAITVTLLLVSRAQQEIDRRTLALNDARAAITRFVSVNTRKRAAGGSLDARRVRTVVLFLDIRDFSSFADTVEPERTVDLVSTVAQISIAAVRGNDGDVDRLLGDGLFARFDGEDRQHRAWTAADHILRQIAALGLDRGVGVSLHEGDVVEAVIAAGDRADSTVLGRAVNVGARLCSLAGSGEIVASDTIQDPPAGLELRNVGTETVQTKGHRAPISIRRFRPACP